MQTLKLDPKNFCSLYFGLLDDSFWGKPAAMP